MKQILLLFVSGFLIVVSMFAQGVVTSLPGTNKKNKPGAEWLTLRANNNRDGRVVSSGEFKNTARLSQAIDYATSEAYIELSPGETTSSVKYNTGEIRGSDLPVSLSAEWQIEPTASLDLYGDGNVTTVQISQNIKYAQLFKNDSKYYRVEAHDGFSMTGNVNNRVFVGIRVYEGNTGKLIFEKELPKGEFMQRPHVTVADMDNDGQSDIVITSWEGIYVFNNKGESIARLSQEASGWHRLRKRGFASIADIDGNGYKDVVIISSLPWHVDVIKNNGGVLEFGWTKIFDGLVESAKKISKPVLNSVNDFDGDGTYEILVNVYNYNDDNNWSGILFDATNGKIKTQIRNAYVLSADAVNNDGRYIFFCTETQGQSVPVAATLKAVIFKNGEIRECLRIGKGEWINPRIANTSPAVTSHRDGISSLAEGQVLCVDYENIGRKAFFAKTRNTDGSTLISGYYITKEGTAKKTAIAINIPPGMYGEIVRSRKPADGKYSLMVQVKAFGIPSGIVRIDGAQVKDLGRYISSNTKTYIPVVADINSDGFAELLISNDVGEVMCFGRNAAGTMSLQWKVPGHGMLWQYGPAIDFGVSVDDLNHDGYKEVIVSGANEIGAVLFVYDHGGKLIWQKSFPEINAGDITVFDGSLAFYGTAQSSKRKNRDVIVTVQRGIAHGGKTYCLNGSDGTIVWQLDTLSADKGPGQGSPVVSGAGGNIFSTYDIDGDGSDEVMCGYGNIVFFADCNDGTVKFKNFMRKLFTDKYDYPSHGYTSFWMHQILPVAFDDEGEVALSCFNTSVTAGTMNTKGTLSWCPEELEYKDRYWQCIANLDGDGKLCVVELSIRSSDNLPVLFAYDPVNGEPHKNFSMEMPDFRPGSEPGMPVGFIPPLASGIMPVACDMNGDGSDEIVISSHTGVHCIGLDKGKPAVLWNYSASGCGPAVVADVDSDGFVEVVTATQFGKILILDSR